MGRVAEEDEKAFPELVRRYQGRVTNLICRVLNDRECSDDLAQEVFVRVYVHRRNYRRGSKFSTWLFTIAANLAKNEIRLTVALLLHELAHSLVAVSSQILIPTPDGGRVAGFEVMLTTPAIENHIRKCETFKIGSVIQTSRRQGMMLMDDCLLDLYREGRIDQETALERSFDSKGLLTRMGGGAAE